MQYRRISLFYPIQVFLSDVVVQGTLKTLKPHHKKGKLLCQTLKPTTECRRLTLTDPNFPARETDLPYPTLKTLMTLKSLILRHVISTPYGTGSYPLPPHG